MSSFPATDAGPVRPLERGLLVAILVAGAAARVLAAGRSPMWFDELYTTWAARGGFAHVVATMARDVHPPLHELLVAGWATLGGESAAWLRALSVLFGLATIVATWALARAAFGRQAALAAAALLALHRLHVYYSQEVRMYALLWLALTVAWWAAWRWLQDGRARHAAAYVAAATVGLYTHYLAGFVLAFTAAAVLVAALRGPGGSRRALAWAGLQLAVATLFAPQVPTFLVQRARLAREHWTMPPDSRGLWDWLRHVAGSASWQVPLLGAIGALAFARREGRAAAAFLAWVVFAPVLFAWWLGTRGAHLFTERYMDYVLPAVAVVLGGGLAAGASLLRERTRLPAAAAWLVLAALLAVELRGVRMPPPVDEGALLARAVACLDAEARPGDVIDCADTHSLLFLAHYRPRLATLRLLWFRPPLPYYEGVLVLPDSLVAPPSAFGATRPAGGRWWGLRVRTAGDNGAAVAALFDSAATRAPRRFGKVTLWGPE